MTVDKEYFLPADYLERLENSFGAELRAARLARHVSVRELARRVHYCHSYVSKVENGVKPPTLKFARQCDEALGLRGTLVDCFDGPATTTAPTWPRPNQLPPGPAHFVGRETELACICAALDDGEHQPGTVPVLVLDGPPGVGKSALALRWAHQNLEQFPDGVLYADLGGHSPVGAPAPPAEVLAAFCRSLGVSDALPPSEQQCSALLRSLLSGRRMLIVLDDALDTPQVRPLLPASPTCAVLVTSRRRLNGLSAREGARSVSVRPFDTATAVALVRKIIGEQRANAEPEAVALLADRCGGLSLALRLAAEWIATQPGRSTGELAAARSLLDELEVDDDPQSALRSVLSGSWRRLSRRTALVFRRLGEHRCTEFDETTVALVAGVCTGQAAVAVRQLLATNLIEPAGAGRYRMLELVGLYANELAVTAGG